MTTSLSTRPKSKSRPAPTKKLLYQTYPNVGNERHGFAVTTLTGRIAWSARLAGQLLENERLIGNGYRYPYCGTIKFLVELDAKDIRAAWAKICRKLRDLKLVAHWNLEIARTNLVDFHLVIRDCPAPLLTSRARKLKAAIRSVCSHKLNLQFAPIKKSSRWINYILKSKITGTKKGVPRDSEDFEAIIASDPKQFTDDVYRNERVVIAKGVRLKACGTIGKFWVKTKAKLTADYRAKKAEDARLSMSVWREADRIADLMQTSTEAVQRELVKQKKAEPGYTPTPPPPPKPKAPRKPPKAKRVKVPLPPFDPKKCDSFTIGESFESVTHK